MLLNGSVKATTFNANETARTVALMDEGDIFPPECIYGKDKGCQYFYEAATSIKCLNIPMKQLRSELEHNTQVKDILFERLALGYIGSLKHLANPESEKRLSISLGTYSRGTVRKIKMVGGD